MNPLTCALFYYSEIPEHLAECGSGTTDDREQIQTVCRLIEEDEVERILSYWLDRIFRNMELSTYFISTCAEKGIKIHKFGWKHLYRYTGMDGYGQLIALR